MYYPRGISASLRAASEQFWVILLTGPRQVGKTTLLQRLAGRDRRYVTLDDPLVRELAQSDPSLFLQRYEPPVLIDEIQYAPQLLPLIKMAVDRNRKRGLFWLTGWQQFHLMKGISETLAGRVAILSLLGFLSRERRRRELDVAPFLPTPDVLDRREATAPKLTLKRVYADIWLGGFPALVTKQVQDRDLFYGSYLQTYLQRDVKDLTQVGNEASFVRFLKACAARTGQLLNLTELARDADVAVNTAKSWLSVLQASFQVYLLQPYHSNVTKRLIKTPKLYFLDTGLCAYLTGWSSPETLEPGAMGGAMLEQDLAEHDRVVGHGRARPARSPPAAGQRNFRHSATVSRCSPVRRRSTGSPGCRPPRARFAPDRLPRRQSARPRPAQQRRPFSSVSTIPIARLTCLILL